MHAREFSRQQQEAMIASGALNKMTSLGMPQSRREGGTQQSPIAIYKTWPNTLLFEKVVDVIFVSFFCRY